MDNITSTHGLAESSSNNGKKDGDDARSFSGAVVKKMEDEKTLGIGDFSFQCRKK